MYRKFMSMKQILTPGGYLPLPGAVFMYVTIIFKHLLKALGQSKSNFMCSIVSKGK